MMNRLQQAREMFVITGGLVILALGLNLFLIPNKIAAGGVSGIGIVLFHLFDLPVGFSMLVMNVILFIVGFYFLGKGFGWRSIVASVLLSVLVDLFQRILPVDMFTGDLLIAVIFGNLLSGAGMAMIFNNGASTGGTDILAKLLNRYASLDIGRSLLVFDFIIGVSAGLVLQSVEVGMYSLLGILINTFAIDFFIGALSLKKQVWVISDHSDEIGQAFSRELNRGYTFFQALGGYTGDSKRVLMSIVRLRQVGSVRAIVRSIDPNAFLIIGTVNEVLGDGFNDIRKEN
ncbi:MAG: YitT family protein [bacterium]|nr:YitT family protein [bacterium]